MCVCLRENEKKQDTKGGIFLFFEAMLGQEVIHKLYSLWLAVFSLTETPQRMFGLGRVHGMWEEPFFKWKTKGKEEKKSSSQRAGNGEKN